MAKKKTDTEAPATEAAAAPAAEEAKAEKGKAPKAEKPAKAPKAKAAKSDEVPADKAAAPAAESPATAAAEGVSAEPTKKRGRPGVPPRRGKKLRAKMGTIANEASKLGLVDFKKAVSFLKTHKRVKFDETVEVHMALGIDPKQSDQMVRGAVPLPHGLGRSKKVLVFTQGENATKAKAAGADFVGADDLAKKITSEGFTDFDVALATPDMMGVVGRLGKVLGPRGLMPSPKAGTVVTGDIAAAVKEFKAGKVEFRADAGGNVHAAVGKLSFDETKLVENITAFVESVKAAKPASSKGHFIKSLTLSATMSPGIGIAVV
ncbi:MAG: 50S ribosomal protein L1 [Planctomycetia bacterium]|nr:50S ribosomal protein L1 [Planctomycetia bacterium]